jgi:RHH-type proline utilization regulon transcriptional repressor/proline dehydrogenase/delta 1-pyrroline-5-carboxylate dehydrogenase
MARKFFCANWGCDIDGEMELQKAIDLLDSVKAKPQSVAERKKISIELASLMLTEATRTITPAEKMVQEQLSRLMMDRHGKAFTTAMTDECFRTSSHKRVADQMIYLLNKFGVPKYFEWYKRAQLAAFKLLSPSIARWVVPLAMRELRAQTERVILPGEAAALSKHLQERKKEGVQLNLNRLGEAILSEEEAKKKMEIYLRDLRNPDIDYISIKISTIYSQINLVAKEYSIEQIGERLKVLYREAMKHTPYKFVNLDMEEYRDLSLTVDVFKKVLEEKEFYQYPAGIVLQAYLPDSFPIQKELTEWAKKRVQNGGGWIKIRIVKGANLAMEQFEASVRGWAQAPYKNKVEVDANYKRMVAYGCMPENARAVRLGIASHNLFDIAFALLLRVENNVEAYTGFEMLEGMADHMRRVVQKLSGSMLLYCPVATKEEFQHAIAYLVRRLDENTGPENFLRHAFGLKPGTPSWENQTHIFSQSCDEMEKTYADPRRKQDRQLHPQMLEINSPFENEADTDFTLPANFEWAKTIAEKWKSPKIDPLPLVIGGKEIYDNEDGVAYSPNNLDKPLYKYAKAETRHIHDAITCAKAAEKEWAATSVEHRSQILARIAQKFREHRGDLMGVMMADGGKILTESDPEVSEAIDFAEYYRRRMEKMISWKDIKWSPKGTALVIPPWNFPCAIPAGCILGALMAGNCVLFKPSSDAVLVGWHVAMAMWDAGVPKEVLQFIPCSGGDHPELTTDHRINFVVLTGGTDTAKHLLKTRPGLDLIGETGGKNSVIITGMADRDLAVKNLAHSAFSHGGQKCSAASLAILEAEVYDDQHFLQHLKNAVQSLKVGPSWDTSSKIGPLIHEPRGVLKKGLTTLEPGETWLLKPKQDEHNPCLWTPGIKLGVKPGSFCHMTELFGPVLSIMRAENLEDAIHIANQVPYGLTSGLESLDDREQAYWKKHIVAGNLYINRSTTGAIVQRQPFGGTKASCIGVGAKAGGPNYLEEFLHAEQIGLPQKKASVNDWVNNLTNALPDLTAEELGLWTASVSNYAYRWSRMKKDHDPTLIVGQDNIFRYLPRKQITLRIEPHTHLLDALRSAAAALTVGAELEISSPHELPFLAQISPLKSVIESETTFLTRVRQGAIDRLRLLEPATKPIHLAAAESSTIIIDRPVLANGRFELLHYLREVSISTDYHRYGNLGPREDQLRKPVM